MTQVFSEAEATVLSKVAQRQAEARIELTRPTSRFSVAVLWLLPSIAMIVFGDALQRTLGINQQTVWLLTFLTAGLCLAQAQIASLQRKVEALSQLLAVRGDA